MKITGIETQLFEYPTSRRRGDAHAPSGRTRQNGILVEILTDSELSGVGMGMPHTEDAIRRLGSTLFGKDPRSAGGLWKTLADRAFKGGVVGLTNKAISALDVALWDLKAKCYDEPLWRLLGATTPRVRAYASGGDMPLSDSQLSDFYGHMAGLGFRAGKLKIGLDIDDDLRRIGIMKEALGGAAARPALMVDASEYWSAKQAVRRITELERHFDLTWVEEPVARADYVGLRTVTEHVRSPIAAGENLDNVHQFLPYVDQRAVDVIQCSWWHSGITGALQVAYLAHGHALPVTVGYSPGKLMAHVAASLPNHMILEIHDSGMEEPVWVSDHVIDDGHIVLSEKPGLGLEVDRAALDAHAVETLQPGSGPNPFGRRAGAGLMEVPATDEEKRIGESGPEPAAKG